MLYEDINMLSVEKPAGILVYKPLHYQGKTSTLHDLVFDKLNFRIKGERNGIVHRLDKETSGVLLLAKNKEAEKKLKEIFKKRLIKKYYTALVWGRVEPIKGKITIPLGRGAKDRLKVVPKASGKPAKTLYSVLGYYPKQNVSLLDIELKTGRMHQIRVHLAAIGHPIVGDSKYSNRKTTIDRQFLHAKKLEFVSPFDGKLITINSNLPGELKTFLNKLS